MKTLLTLLIIAQLTLDANVIKLNEKQTQNWQIKTSQAEISDRLPIGNYLLEVSTPPYFLRAITLAFDAQVSQLYVAPYQSIDQGAIIADVSSPVWIESQTTMLSNLISFKEIQTKAYRKNRLCTEGIIPKKECSSINAMLSNAKVKLSASKAVLKAYGADDETIQNIEKKLKITPTLSLHAPITGTITTLNAQVGKTINASTPLLVIQEAGRKWLGAFIPQDVIPTLKKHQNITIMIEGKSYPATIINFSPIINRQNQTRHVRFILNEDIELLSGFRTQATLSIPTKTRKIPKKSVVKSEGHYLLFIKTDKGYEDIQIDILSEDDDFYYVEENPALTNPIVTTSLATLKALLGEDDE